MARRGSPAHIASLVIVAAVATAGSSGQDTPSLSAPRAAPAADAASIAPVRVDVMVADRRGRPVLDLKAGDFELRDGGVAQELLAADLRDTRTLSPRALPADTPADNEERLAAEPGTRVFAFVLDEFHVTPGETSDRVRASVDQFINDRLRSDDLAIALKPLDSLTSLRFTRNRQPLRDAVAAFAGRKGDDSARTPFERQFIGSAPEAVHAARAQIITAALRETAFRMAELHPERATIVYVGEGFARPAAGTRTMRPPDLPGLIRACSRFNIPVYVFNPAPAADPDSDAGRAAATLKGISTQTGGEMVTGLEAFQSGLQRMDNDLTVYYALSFQPPAADGRYHAIEVLTTRADLVVRTRPGYWAPLPALRPSTPLPPISTRELKHSTLIAAWTGITRTPDGHLQLVVTWEPRTSNRSAAALLVTARTAAGAPLFSSKIAQAGEKAAGLSGDSARFDVPPGRVELDLSVLSMSGAVLDVDKRDVTVPVLGARKGPLLFTPGIVRARTLPEYRAVSEDPLAAPSPSRSFRRGDRLLVRASAWDQAAPSVDLTAQLLNVAGRPMRQLDRSAKEHSPAGAEFDLPLAWLAPGEYAIEVRAHSQNGDAKEQVRFTVR